MAINIDRGSEKYTLIDQNLKVGRKFVLPLKLDIPTTDEPGSIGLNENGKLFYKDRNGQIKEVANAGEVSSGYTNYEHVQSSPQSTWVINHNLNRKPSIIVTDTSGTVVLGETQYIDNNQVIVKFNNPFSGTVICN